MHPVQKNRTGQPWVKPGHDERVDHAAFAAPFSASIRRASTQRK
jgi:hypothetical protein